MNPAEICLPRKLTHQLLHLAQLSPDAEVCGLVGANPQGMPVSCYPVQNDADTPANRFLLDARQQISAMKQIREKGETLFAVYHSHPTAPAIPSPSDIEHADYPPALHLIISLNTKGVLEMRGFQIQSGQARELVLRLVDE